MRFVLICALLFVCFCVGCRTIQAKCHELCDAVQAVTED